MRGLLAVAAVIATCAACAQVPGEPTAAARATTTTTPPAPVSAPPVTPLTEVSVEPPDLTARPLDLAPWADDLCGLLTDAEAAALGFTGKGQTLTPDPQGGRCERTGPGGRVRVRVYARDEMVTGMLARWRPGEVFLARAEVGDYPAVVWTPQPEPAGGECEVGVLVAATQSLHVDVESSAGACDSALAVAGYVVRRVGA